MFERTGVAYIGGLESVSQLRPLANDVYALGSILCLTITGRLPHDLAGLTNASAGERAQWYENGGFHADTQAINTLRYLAQDDRVVDIIMGATHPDDMHRTAAFDLVGQLTQLDKELRVESGVGSSVDVGRHRGEESPILRSAGHAGRHSVSVDTEVLPIFEL